MLPKSKRLNLGKDFKWVAAGQKIETKYLKIFFRFGNNDIPKVGVAVSGKLFQKATQRNKAKRFSSTAIEKVYNLFPKSINIIVLPKTGIVNVKSTDVFLDVQEVLKAKKLI